MAAAWWLTVRCAARVSFGLWCSTESFEAERCDFIGRVASLTRSAPPSAAASTWASQELAWQVAALQRHLSDARVALHEERRNALSAHALVHTVRLQALEERRRTAGQRPTEPKYAVDAQLPQKENRPPNVQRQPQYSTAAGAPVPRVPLRARHPLAEHGRSQKADPSAALLERTADDLRLLRSDEGRAASLRVEALNADRRVREKEHAAELSALRAAMARGRDEHAEISDRLHRTTRDYMALRHAAQRNEREHLERVATLSQQRDHMQHVLRALQHALKYAHEAAQPSLGTVGFASFDDSPTAASLSAASAAAASMTLSAGPEAAETSPLVPSGPSRRRVRPPLPSLGRPRVRGVVDERVIEYHAGEMHDLMHHCAQLERELQAARSQAEGAHSREDERARTAEDDAARWRRRAEREEERRRLAKEGYEVDLRRLRDHVRSLEGLVLHVDLARRRDRLSAGREVGDSDAQSGAASMFEVHVEQVEAAVRDMDDDLTRFAQRLADAQ